MSSLTVLTRLGRVCLAAALCATLGACQTTSGLSSIQGTTPQMDVAEVDPVAQSLVAAAERTSDAIARLAAVENARTPVPDPGRVGPVAPPGLGNVITLDWVGPAEPLVARLASAAGYEFRAVGKAPSVPMIVDVTAQDEQIVYVLREVGHQLSNRAMITVDAELAVVEVRYAH